MKNVSWVDHQVFVAITQSNKIIKKNAQNLKTGIKNKHFLEVVSSQKYFPFKIEKKYLKWIGGSSKKLMCKGFHCQNKWHEHVGIWVREILYNNNNKKDSLVT